MILDTSGVLVFLDASATDQPRVDQLIADTRQPLLMSPFVLAEVDHLVSTRLGPAAARSFLQDVADGAYQLESMTPADVGAACAIMDRYRDLDIGLADASSVVLAERHGMPDILTFDQRHFRTVTWGKGKPFRLLPADT